MTKIEIIDLGIRNIYRLREELDAQLETLYAKREEALANMSVEDRMKYLGFTDVGDYIRYERQRAAAKVLAELDIDESELPYLLEDELDNEIDEEEALYDATDEYIDEE